MSPIDFLRLFRVQGALDLLFFQSAENLCRSFAISWYNQGRENWLRSGQVHAVTSPTTVTKRIFRRTDESAALAHGIAPWEAGFPSLLTKAKV
jgi:hypothetical protein